MLPALRLKGPWLSEYYLAELLHEDYAGSLGEHARKRAWCALLARWEHARAVLGPATPSETVRREWLEPLFAACDYALVPDPHRSRTPQGRSEHAFVLAAHGVPLALAETDIWNADLDGGAPGGSPHARLERALAESTWARWGMLASGVRLRLIPRPSPPGMVEFDLEQLFERQDERTFEVFWSLVRADTLRPDATGRSLLDRIVQSAREHGVRVNASLRRGVLAALQALVQGLLDDPRNRRILNPERDLPSLFEQAVTCLYRLLFVLFAESRGLLPLWHPTYRQSYSLQMLRAEIERPRVAALGRFAGRERGVWESLQALCRLVNDGCRAGSLKVTAYDGKLFAPRESPWLERCAIGDAVARDVLLALSVADPDPARGRCRISYRDLGVEQLGAVYETILDYEPRIAPRRIGMVCEQRSGYGPPGGRPPATSPDGGLPRPPDEVKPGRFYLEPSGGRRKATGTYYTPQAVTEFLVARALAPLVDERSADAILALRVLDPSMGSGAFLVSACRYLADAYGRKLAHEGRLPGPPGPADQVTHRRLVAERCLFGVDVNPMAVQLARVSLWLVTAAADRPLTFLDHHLRCGDSLVGTTLEELDAPLNAPGSVPPHASSTDPGGRRFRASSADDPRGAYPAQLALFSPGELEAAMSGMVRERLKLALVAGDSLARARAKDRWLRALNRPGSPLSRLRAVADLRCATSFWHLARSCADGSCGSRTDRSTDDLPRLAPDTALYRQLAGYLLTGRSLLADSMREPYLAEAARLAAERRFFHWPIEFPEAFFDESGNRLPDAGFHAVIGNPPWEMMRADCVATRADTQARFRADCLAKFIRTSAAYGCVRSGAMNMFQLFLERSHFLAAAGGRLSLVLPGGFCADRGSSDLRRLIFEECSVESLVGFGNRARIFPVHRSVKFVLLSARKGGRTDYLPAAFGLTDTVALADATSRQGDLSGVLSIPMSLIKTWTPADLVVPELKDPLDVEILRVLVAAGPALGEPTGPWQAAFSRELNVVEDRPLFNQRGRGMPVFEGKMIQQFTRRFGSPRHWIDDRAAARALVAAATYANDRLAYREVASATNRTTLIATILPRGVVTAHTLYCLRVRDPDGTRRIAPREQLFLCGVLNSYVANYFVRQRVSSHVSVFVIERLPVPRVTDGDARFEAIAERAGALVCGDPSLDAFARDADISSFARSGPARDRAVAELNALVAGLYGLTRGQFEHILSTFPLVEPSARGAALECFLRFAGPGFASAAGPAPPP